jgi:hypothetical protein
VKGQIEITILRVQNHGTNSAFRAAIHGNADSLTRVAAGFNAVKTVPGGLSKRISVLSVLAKWAANGITSR